MRVSQPCDDLVKRLRSEREATPRANLFARLYINMSRFEKKTPPPRIIGKGGKEGNSFRKICKMLIRVMWEASPADLLGYLRADHALGQLAQDPALQKLAAIKGLRGGAQEGVEVFVHRLQRE